LSRREKHGEKSEMLLAGLELGTLLQRRSYLYPTRPDPNFSLYVTAANNKKKNITCKCHSDILNNESGR
jgi:hypothetical protein